MKKILFSGMMCATFVVLGILVSQEMVEAGGGWHVEESCTENGWQMTQCLIVEPYSCYIYTGDVFNHGDSVTILDDTECSVCGDSIIESEEECDDGNLYNGDGCDSKCLNEIKSVCGNGIEEDGEQCDDANDDDMDGCTSECVQCSIDFDGIGGGPLPCDQTADDDSSNDEKGDFRVKIKTYDCNGNEESKKIEGSKVKLYQKDGDKEDEDKTNSKGEANFHDVEEGNYYVKCEVPGYVNLKDRSKTYYKSGTEKVKDGERAHETCHLIKESCDANVKVENLSQTGGSLKSLIEYVFSLVF